MTEWNYCPVCGGQLATNDKGYPTCSKNHFTKWPTPVTTTIAVVRNQGEYLLLKRAQEPRKGEWDLPGGFLEYDETAEECVLREIQEETGMTNVTINEYLGTFPSDYGDIEKVVSVAYILESTNRDVTLSEENSEHKWVSLEDMPELAFKDTNAARDLLRQRMI